MRDYCDLNMALFKVRCYGAGIIVLIAFAVALPAAAAGIDTAFGDGGKVFMPINQLPSQVRTQPDGKIVTLTCDYWDDGYSVLSRRNADGTVDTTFGDNGYLQSDYKTGIIFDFLIQPDGKLVGTGETLPGEQFVIFRYNPDGTPDKSFGNGGSATPLVRSFRSAGISVVLQRDGKIVAAGFADNPNLHLVVRYNSDGTPDATFGVHGIVGELAEGIGSENVLVQHDGKLIVTEWRSLVRYNSDGTPDSSFGNAGKVDGFVDRMALQTDGKIVLQSGVGLKRLTADGIADNSFGTNGNASSIRLSAWAIAAEKNGKIVVAGASDGNFALSRYNANGTIDGTFGTNGLIVTPLGNPSSYNKITALALQEDGNIVGAGYFWSGSFPGNATLVRYLADDRANRHFDFDGDGRSDLVVFRPSDGIWYLNRSTAGFAALHFGLSTDKMVAADYDGDGKTDIAVYRDGFWYWVNSSSSVVSVVQFGSANDIPQPADFSGDGRADLAVYRAGTWWTLDLSNGQIRAVQYGIAGDVPVSADYDGDGKADHAVIRGGTWYIDRSTDGATVMQFGLPTDIPVPADYDGDGKTDPAMYRQGMWYLSQSSRGFAAFAFGMFTDTPTPADYDGDGRADPAVFRAAEGTWYQQRSTLGYAVVHFGAVGDVPVRREAQPFDPSCAGCWDY